MAQIDYLIFQVSSILFSTKLLHFWEFSAMEMTSTFTECSQLWGFHPMAWQRRRRWGFHPMGGHSMLRGARDSLTGKQRCLRFLGFLVWKFLGFFVSKIQDPWMRSNVFNPYYQMFRSCCLAGIDRISKFFKIWLDGPAGFVGARLCGNCKTTDFPNFEIYHNICKNVPGFLD